MLTLRFPEAQDAEAVLDAVRESFDELHKWMSWCGTEYSIADASRWVADQVHARESGSAFEFAVLGAHGRLLGCCGINQVNKGHRMANLGYWVRTSAAGQGVATESARLAAAWAFAHTDLERLEIVASVGNTASQAVALKVGALREGVLRSRLLVHGEFHDAVLFSLIRPAGAAP